MTFSLFQSEAYIKILAEQFNKCVTRSHLFRTKSFRKAPNPTLTPWGGAVQMHIEAGAQEISAWTLL